MAKRGRPRGLNIHPGAVEHELRRLNRPKSWLAVQIGISTSHLSEAMGPRRKGIDEEVIREMALLLGCPADVLAPELTGFFVCVRPGDAAPVQSVPA